MNPWLLIGSLAGVLGLAAAAWILGLGGAAIGGDAARIAEETQAGFVAAKAVTGDDGQAAVVLGADGSVMLLKTHGARVAARHLQRPVALAADEAGLRVASGDARFGEIRLALADRAAAQALAATIGATRDG